MNFDELQENLIGDWGGSNLLRTPWLTPPEGVSSSQLRVAPVAKGNFLTFTYTWSDKDVPQEGLILFGHDKAQGATTAAWVDSWHVSSKILSLEGSLDEQGVILLRGSYEAPPGPDWGWRIEITAPSSNELRIVMYNISPEGEEELAVKADYTRAGM